MSEIIEIRLSYIKRLKLTKVICEHNLEQSILKISELERKLEIERKNLEKLNNTNKLVEKQIRDYYGSIECNVKKVD